MKNKASELSGIGRRRSKGFTLIELVITIAVSSVVVAFMALFIARFGTTTLQDFVRESYTVVRGKLTKKLQAELAPWPARVAGAK